MSDAETPGRITAQDSLLLGALGLLLLFGGTMAGAVLLAIS